MFVTGRAPLMHSPGWICTLRVGAFTWSHLIEETLRHTPPVANLPLRYALVDIDVAGARIKAGEAILACFAAANRDPNLYGPDADDFDPARPIKEHLSFGYGPHYCLGAPLARMEAAIALPALFGRFPQMAFAVAPEAVKPLASFISHGHQRLPVLLDGAGGADLTAESGL